MKHSKLTFQKLRGFAGREDGGVTLEAVMWFPLYAFMIVFVLDASMIFTNAAKVQRMVQDGTRAFSYGGIQTCTDLETWLQARISQLAPSATVTCNDTAITNMVRIQAVVPSNELDLSGATGALGSFDLGFQIEHMVEL